MPGPPPTPEWRRQGHRKRALAALRFYLETARIDEVRSLIVRQAGGRFTDRGAVKETGKHDVLAEVPFGYLSAVRVRLADLGVDHFLDAAAR